MKRFIDFSLFGRSKAGSFLAYPSSSLHTTINPALNMRDAVRLKSGVPMRGICLLLSLLMLLALPMPVHAQSGGPSLMSLTIVAPTSLPEPGGAITYTVQIANHFNDVNAPILTNIQLTQIDDTVYGDLTDAANPNISNSTCSLATIAAGATYECTFGGIFMGNAGVERSHTTEATGINVLTTTLQASASHTVQIASLPPTLQVTMEAAATIPEPGGAVAYTIAVNNTSAATDPVVLTQLSSSVFGNLVDPNNAEIRNSTCTLAAIAPGKVYVCTFEGQVTGNAGEALLSTATARGSDDEGALSSFAIGNFTVTIADVLPTLLLSTRATPNRVLESGEDVTFVVEVTNKSVESVTLQPLNSAELGNLAGRGSCTADAVLVASGELYACSFDALLSGDASAPAQPITIAAQATDDEGNEATAQQANAIGFTDAQPAIDIQLGADPNDIPEGGADVLFKVHIQNSRTEPVRLDQLTDTIFGNLNGVGDCVADGSHTIAGNESYTCTFTKQVIGNYGDPQKSYLVMGAASDNEGNRVESQDETAIAFLNVPAEIALRQTPRSESVPESGGEVTYDLLLENRSLVDAVTIRQITDSLLGDLTHPSGELRQTDCAVPLALKPGTTASCQFVVHVAGSAGSKRTSEATASGDDEDGDSILAKSSATVQIEDVPSSLRLDVTVDGATAPPLGRTVAYTVEIENDSPVDQVTVTALRDVELGDLTDAANPKLHSTDCLTPQPLTVDQRYTCHYRIFVAGKLGETIASVVTTDALDDDGFVLEREAAWQVQIAEPVITMTKKDILLIDADANQVVSAGDTILYQVNIQNGGNATASNVIFDDTIDAKTALLPGSVQTSQGQIRGGAPNEQASVQITFAELPPESSAAISFQVLITESAVSGELFNQAVIHFDNPFNTTTGQSLVLSDDPDTAAIEDTTATPIGGFISTMRLYLPLMKQ